MPDERHIPVLQEEVIAHFQPKNTDTLLDATLGLGGHARAYLKAAGPGAKVIGLDADREALQEAKSRLAEFEGQVVYVHSTFARLADAAAGKADHISHILFDLGVGSHQLSDPERGFSFKSRGPLNMMYGSRATELVRDRQEAYLPPADVETLNMLERRLRRYPDVPDILRLPVEDLAYIIRFYGEERFARRIAKAITTTKPMPQSARELAAVIEQAAGYSPKSAIHPATRTFQALRIAVNRELESLRAALPQAVALLAPGGKLVVISFHSLEDRIVKQFFRRESKDCVCPSHQVICVCMHRAKLSIVTKRPLVASDTEVKRNPRSRSAKMRVAVKLE